MERHGRIARVRRWECDEATAVVRVVGEGDEALVAAPVVTGEPMMGYSSRAGFVAAIELASELPRRGSRHHSGPLEAWRRTSWFPPWQPERSQRHRSDAAANLPPARDRSTSMGTSARRSHGRCWRQQSRACAFGRSGLTSAAASRAQTHRVSDPWEDKLGSRTTPASIQSIGASITCGYDTASTSPASRSPLDIGPKATSLC